MTLAEKVELALIPAISLASFIVAPSLPTRIALGSLLLVIFALLLSQSLLRDLWLLSSSKREASSGPAQVAQCMCVESAVGATGVLAGILLLGTQTGHPVEMAGWGWMLCVSSVGVAGFLIRELVFEWSPWSIRREKNHVNIIVRWKK